MAWGGGQKSQSEGNFGKEGLGKAKGLLKESLGG